MKSVTGSGDDEYLYFTVKSWTTKFSGTDKSLLDIVEYFPIISSQRVNWFLYKGIYTPPEVFTYSNGENTRRYDYVSAIRILRCQMLVAEDEYAVISSLQDIEKVLTQIGLNCDLGEMLSPISKEEFDNLEIPTMPFL